MIKLELHSVHAEESVIRSLLENKIELLEDIKLDYFCNKNNRAITKAVMDLHSKNIGIDYITVTEQLKNNKADIPSNLIIELVSNSLPIDIKSDVKILKDLYKRRMTITTLQDAIDKLKDTDSNIDNINTTIASKIDQLTFEDDHTDDSTPKIIKRLEIDLKSSVDIREQRYQYGIPGLDNLTWGLHKQELTTIAAKSGVGKTALALQIAKNLLTEGLRVLIISREMSDVQIFKRLLVSFTGIQSNKFRSRSFTQKEWDVVNHHMAVLKQDMKLHVNTQISTVTGIKKRIRQVKPEVVIIDYLQLLTPEKSENNREREVATISREIKSMTNDFNIPIIQLSQLNDEFGDCRPKGERAMRESKSIYQNSNNVIYIHQPNEKELKKHIESGRISLQDIRDIKEHENYLVEIILDKQRDGATGIFVQEYVKDRLKFTPTELTPEGFTRIK